MATKFLESLSLTPAERSKLAALAVDDADSLYAMLRAAPLDFRKFFGEEQTRRLESELRKQLGTFAIEELDAAPKRYSLGVPMSRPAPPVMPDPPAQLLQRDALLEKLKRLRKVGAPAAEIRAAETELNQLLESDWHN